MISPVAQPANKALVADANRNISNLGTIGSGAITATDTTAPLILKYDAQEYVTHAVSSAGVYSITTTDVDSNSGQILLDAPLGTEIKATNAATNAAVELLKLNLQSSGTPADNLGIDISFNIESSANNNEKGMVLEALMVDSNSGNDNSEDVDFLVKLMANGQAAAEKFRVTMRKVAANSNDGYVDSSQLRIFK